MEQNIMNPVELYLSYNKVQTDLVLETLERNNIPAYKASAGAGQLMTIYMGNSIAGETIYVDTQDQEKALEILNLLGLTKETSQPSLVSSKPPYSKTAMWAARIALVLVIGIILFSFFNSIG
ncbi:hypothetical protein M2454_000589 [Aequitasia blattaphilus]|uniref:DUF2007 domain-containing protein n=1 Tax=Aequitasia blattaphilus TaxID=2949332 RepID=A0ABT1E8P3_9FIRM|nr:hypothetical protein [Aequitasia blattaphilus]MCP1102192.1 hypothetical protein [Aequitasia blattaphilus]MCR8614832.1 hypothetical protein [Aequitasia blattaphilus]